MIKVYFAPAVLETVPDEYCKQMIQMVWIIYYRAHIGYSQTK